MLERYHQNQWGCHQSRELLQMDRVHFERLHYMQLLGQLQTRHQRSEDGNRMSPQDKYDTIIVKFTVFYRGRKRRGRRFDSSRRAL